MKCEKQLKLEVPQFGNEGTCDILTVAQMERLYVCTTIRNRGKGTIRYFEAFVEL